MVKKLEEELKGKKNAIFEDRRIIEGLEALIINKDLELKNVSVTVDELHQKIEDLNKNLKSKDDKISSLGNNIEKLEDK